jgi:hypothetical protein
MQPRGSSAVQSGLAMHSVPELIEALAEPISMIERPTTCIDSSNGQLERHLNYFRH